jgi:hypothetical protein
VGRESEEDERKKGVAVAGCFCLARRGGEDGEEEETCLREGSEGGDT